MINILPKFMMLGVLALASFNLHAQTCDGLTRITSDSGTLEDGSGDSDYDYNLYCTWVLKPESGGPIRIFFDSLDIRYYYLYIYADTVAEENLIASLTEDEIPGAILSNSDSVYLVFVTGCCTPGKGWTLHYESNVSNSAPVVEVDTVDVLEQSLPGTIVGDTLASDPDGDALVYSILSGNEDSVFAIAPDGRIVLAESLVELDFEVQNQYNIEIGVTDGIEVIQFAVTINVTDIDELLAPQMNDTTFSIPENAFWYHLVGTLQVDGAVSFSPVIADDRFGVYPNGEIDARAPYDLDFETEPEINLHIGVTNGAGYSSRAVITIMLEDIGCSGEVLTANSGTFEDGSGDSYYEEDSDCSWVITPDDGGPVRIKFEYSYVNYYDAFTVYEGSDNTGEVLDEYSRSTSAILEQRVYDAASVVFNFKANNMAQGWEVSYEGNAVNNAPILSNQTFGVLEDFSKGYVFAKIEASDPDGDFLTYEIISGNDEDIFEVREATGYLILSYGGPNLDASVKSSYEITVEVSDGAKKTQAVVTINVVKPEDVSPLVLNDTTISVPENNEYGTTLFSLTETDMNGILLSYRVLSISSGSFNVSNYNQLIAYTNLNYESITSYSLEVEVSNSIDKDTATITIEVIDIDCQGETLTTDTGVFSDGSGEYNYDVYSSCSWLIQPDSADAILLTVNNFETTTDVGQVAIYAGVNGGGTLIAELSGQIEPGTSYLVEDTSAYIYFNSNYTSAPGWEFSYSVYEPLVVADQGFDIEENLATDAEVGTIEVTSGSPLPTFSILSGNTGNAFAVEEESGTISVLTQGAVDFETNPSFNLQVLVMGPIDQDTINVTINVSDINEAPALSDIEFIIEEDITNGTLVGTLNAKDPEGDTVIYSIGSGNTDGAFELNAEGEITAANVSAIDFASAISMTIVVNVSDQVLSASANVTIRWGEETILAVGPQGNELSFYPNPSDGKVTIQFSKRDAKNLSVSLLDLSGAEVIKVYEGIGIEKLTFDVSSLSSGLYLLKIEEDHQTVVNKLQIR